MNGKFVLLLVAALSWFGVSRADEVRSRLMWTSTEVEKPDVHVGFRGTFSLAEDATVDLQLSGASWYVVWIDGNFYTEGPDRYTAAYPEYQCRKVDLKKERTLLPYRCSMRAWRLGS